MANVSGVWVDGRGNIYGFQGNIAPISSWDFGLGQLHQWYMPILFIELEADQVGYGVLPAACGDSTKTDVERVEAYNSGVGGAVGLTVASLTNPVSPTNPVIPSS